jgi:formylglycine-generating enzyme required for sulfatase activity
MKLNHGVTRFRSNVWSNMRIMGWAMPSLGRAWETGNCYFRVVRGGAYTSASTSLRTRKRDRYRKDQGYQNIGFRVVREP